MSGIIATKNMITDSLNIKYFYKFIANLITSVEFAIMEKILQ